MASLGGFGAVVGDGGLSGGTTAPGRYFIDTLNTVTSDGTFESFDIYVDTPKSGETLKIKVFRTNGSNYDFVGETQSVSTTGLASGLNSGITVDVPFGVLAGDLIAVFMSDSGVFKVASTSGGAAKFKTGDHTTTQAIASYTDIGTNISVEIFGTPSGSMITLDEKGVGQVFQRSPSTLDSSVTISGSYAGTPTAIECRILQASDDTTEVVGWIVLDAAPSGGVFTGTITVPQGGWYHAQVRYSNDTGVTDIQSSDWGVGVLVGGIGQSNLENWNTDGTGTPHALTSKYISGTWSKQETTGTGHIGFLNAIATALSIPVGIVNYAVGGSGLVAGVTSPYWGDFTASLYTNFKNAVTSIGGKLEFVLWVQGEQDAFVGSPTATEANYTSTLNSLITEIRSDIVNGSDQTNLPFIISQLGRTTSGSLDSDIQAIRNALHNVATTTVDCHLGANIYDMPLSDTVHLTPAGYTIHGQRMAQTVLYILGNVSYYRGPQIASAALADTSTIDISITHSGGTTFNPTSGITGFEIFDDGVPVAISAAVRHSPTVIRLTLGAAVTGSVTARYMYGSNPVVTGVVVDDSSLVLPLEMSGNFFAVSAVSSTITMVLSGIPDGTYKVVLVDTLDDTVIYATNVTFTSGSGSAIVSRVSGSKLKGYVDDGLETPINGAMIYGVTA